MDTSYLLSLLQESIYLILVFAAFFMLSLWKGRYALINIIFSLYLALLITLEFPFFDSILQDASTIENATVKISFFVAMTILGAFLFRRHIPGDDYEKTFENFTKKIILSLLATSLVMAFSYYILPIADLIHPGTPIQILFGNNEYFFWWLTAPIILLFFL